MSIYVVEIKLPYESYASRLGVFHSNSETMFAPVFSEEEKLIAHIFAYFYSTRREMADYSEASQSTLNLLIRAFLDLRFPEHKEATAKLPSAWMQFFNDDDPDGYCHFDRDDLVDMFENDKAGAADVMHDFYQWRTEAK